MGSATAAWLGWRVDDRHGRRLGSLAAVYRDAEGPTWFLVRLSDHTARYVLVPPADVLATRGRVQLPYGRETIAGAPACPRPPEAIAPELEARMRRHFRLADAGSREVRVVARRSVA
jgi:hypothetical protein